MNSTDPSGFSLSTPRLMLRDFAREDWIWTHPYESDPEVARYQSFEPRTEAESRDYIERGLADASASPRRTFDLAVLLDGAPLGIGRAGLHLSNIEEREGCVWYVFARAMWGRGYATEAVGCLLEFGFEQLGLHRIWADVDPRNAASARVLEKLGFRREAHHVENTFLKGEWCDSWIYALLDREWRTARSARIRA